jgi:serine/threonine protein kinase
MQMKGLTFALKEFTVVTADVKKFMRELRVLHQLKHPYIVRISGYFLEKQKAFVIMPFYEAGTLAEWLNGKSHCDCVNEEAFVFNGTSDKNTSYSLNFVKLVKIYPICHQKNFF